MLTQNTNWTNVEKVLVLLKQKKALSLNALLNLPRTKVETYFRSSGYFRQKSARVVNFLRIVQKEAGGSISRFLKGPLPVVRKRLLEINGIGPETADSMLLYAAGKPIFVVDAYTRRIGKRLRFLKGGETYDEVQQIFMRGLPRSAKVFGEFHALLVKLAKETRA